jgi:hypothetical protein
MVKSELWNFCYALEILNEIETTEFKFEALKIMTVNIWTISRLEYVVKDIFKDKFFKNLRKDEHITACEVLSGDGKEVICNIDYTRDVGGENITSNLEIKGYVKPNDSNLSSIDSVIICEFKGSSLLPEVTRNVTVESNILFKSKEKDNKVIKGLPSKEEVKKQQSGELSDNTSEDKKCIVCWEAVRTYLLLPCSLCLLSVTSKDEKLCPFCREEINEVIRVIFP